MDKYGYTASYMYGKMRQLLQPYINQYIGYKPDMDMVYPNLYISNFATSCDKEYLMSIGITHIVTSIIGISPNFPEHFTYLQLDIGDTPDYNISDHFEIVNSFINDALEIPTNKVLVHCMYGISRSVTLVSAYLISKNISKTYTSKNAIDSIKEFRPIANPNFGFTKQLELYRLGLLLIQ